ncbi:MAG: ABC transporter ATP-binding protein [Lachnospiraceae bacterium]|nr:ABC transporter ATP-binding protein [Lachnoclostridium sp.]MDY2598779.1 ABC transporter ATP-binding protein [Lachnospiraceae bacterium]
MEVLKFGMKYWKKNVPMAVFIQICSFIAITCDLLLPMLSEMFIDYVILEHPVQNDNIFSFLLTGKYGEVHTVKLFTALAVTFMILLMIRLMLVYFKNVNTQKLGVKLETDLRLATYRKVMELDSVTLSEFNTGEILTTANADTVMYKELFCTMLVRIFDSIFVLSLSSYLLFRINWTLLFIPLLLMPFFIVALINFKKRARENYRNIRACNSNMSLTVQENIEAVRLVRSFTNEDVEEEKFHKSNENLKNAYIKQVNLSSKFEVVFSTIKQIAYISSIAITAVLVVKGYILVGYLVTSSGYVLKIMDHISQINNTLFIMQQQIVSGRKMIDFLGTESKVPDKKDGTVIKKLPDINVSNGYLVIGRKTVLKDINIDIPYGKKLGIVGGTGSGKSVLLESLVRIHDLTGGSIKINGTDVRDISLESLRDTYSYVFQDVFLFSDTIDSNIAYAVPDIERQQVVQAAKHAQAHNFIKNLTTGYDTVVGERGLGISGGQKQRVSIARALLKDAPVLVFDDSTSALDVNTEKQLLEDIRVNYPDKTVLISAHRLSSVAHCDEILFMQDGMIVERGTFDELMALNGHFANVYNVQETQKKTVVDCDSIGEEA